MGIYETLIALDDDIVDWILHATPKTDDDKENMRKVLSLRGVLDQTLNQLVDVQLKLAANAMVDEANQLDRISAQMESTQKTIDTVQTVIGIAGTAVEIAGKALAFAMGA